MIGENEIETNQVEMKSSVWTVNKYEDQIQVIDSEGRERHRSRGHMVTACYLAMALEELEFKSTPHLDNVLQLSASTFPHKFPPQGE